MSKVGYLCVGDDVSNLKIYEIINKYFGENYKGYMQAWYDIDDEYAAWFPKIHETNTRPNGSYGGTRMWSNTLSPDKKVITEVNHDVKHEEAIKIDYTNSKKRLVFARINGRFRFLGVFETHPIYEADVLTRQHIQIATEYELRYSVNTVSTEKTDSINTPLKLKGIIRKKDGTVRYVCGRCGESFFKSPRCPECGQLVKE